MQNRNLRRSEWFHIFFNWERKQYNLWNKYILVAPVKLFGRIKAHKWKANKRASRRLIPENFQKGWPNANRKLQFLHNFHDLWESLKLRKPILIRIKETFKNSYKMFKSKPIAKTSEKNLCGLKEGKTNCILKFWENLWLS